MTSRVMSMRRAYPTARKPCGRGFSVGCGRCFIGLPVSRATSSIPAFCMLLAPDRLIILLAKVITMAAEELFQVIVGPRQVGHLIAIEQTRPVTAADTHEVSSGTCQRTQH